MGFNPSGFLASNAPLTSTALPAGAIILAKLALVPVRRGYWGNKIGKVHTVRRPSGSRGVSVGRHCGWEGIGKVHTVSMK
jgi:hypothetical protein